MGVLDGQAVSAAVTNPAFLDANGDDVALGVIGFHNSLPASGPFIDNIQLAVNNLFTTTGASESYVADQYSGAPANTVSAGDDHELAIKKLADKFHGTSGHTHDGTDGNGPSILSSTLSGVPLKGYVLQGTDLTGVTGSTWDVSTELTGKTPSSGITVEGVVVTNPENKIVLRQATGTDEDDVFKDGSGNIVYGRLTESGLIWTLSFFVNISGTETGYTFSIASDVRWYYQELFNPMVNPPTYSEYALIPSDNATADIVIATNAVYGKTLLSSSTSYDIASTGTVGTANGIVANSDHTHKGVRSLGIFGDATKLFGDIDLEAGSNVNLTRTAQRLKIDVLFGGTGSLINAFQEIPSGAVNGSNVNFTLSQAPQTDEALIVTIDGAVVDDSLWSLSGTTLTFTTAPSTGQQIYVFYGGDTVVAIQEIPSGTVNGVNTVFTLTNNPINSDNLIVMIDGLIIDHALYSLTGSTITFTTAPSSGQFVYSYYFSVGTPSLPSGNIEVEYRTLTALEVASKQLTLAATPNDGSKLLLDAIGGTSQEYSVDFTVSGAVLDWNGLGLDGLLSTGDKLRIFYLT